MARPFAPLLGRDARFGGAVEVAPLAHRVRPLPLALVVDARQNLTHQPQRHELNADQPGDRAAVIVTAPLTTNETWTAFQPGELKVFVDGLPA